MISRPAEEVMAIPKQELVASARSFTIRIAAMDAEQRAQDPDTAFDRLSSN
jgi:hypothetical protein